MKDNGWKGLLAFLLVGMAVVGVLGAVSNGFTNWPTLPTSSGPSSSFASGSANSGTISSNGASNGKPSSSQDPKYNSVTKIISFDLDINLTKSNYPSSEYSVGCDSDGWVITYLKESKTYVFTAEMLVSNSEEDPGFLISNGFIGTNKSSTDQLLLSFICSKTNIPSDFFPLMMSSGYEYVYGNLYFGIHLSLTLSPNSTFLIFSPSILIDGLKESASSCKIYRMS